MALYNLTILSYHQFVEEESEYPFSRTFEQFDHDIRKKHYDWITIDDGRICSIRACEMLQSYNVRAKLFICTGLVGQPGYCTWDALRELSRFHDIENHSHYHKDHSSVIYKIQEQSIRLAQEIITAEIGKAPRYFVAPYNQYNDNTDKIAISLGLTCVKDRENILNRSK